MKISLEISKHADQKKDLVGVKRRQQQLVRMADFLPPVTFLVFFLIKSRGTTNEILDQVAFTDEFR